MVKQPHRDPENHGKPPPADERFADESLDYLTVTTEEPETPEPKK